ncbi:MAG TPA: MlaD family protein [Solirubrobacteraceae bacterium]|nr:MlaD family protein [Solirubrobacteraceae bacterium]
MKKSARWRRGAIGFAAVAAGAAAILAIVLLSAAGGSNGSYTVRAIFDDANNVTEGEEVKAQGAKIGKVGEVTATPEGKAAVQLHIENPGFQNFRADASCTILPQSLLGEQYVNCNPTQPHPEGAAWPPALKRIPEGREGAGEVLLPLSNTSSPVGVDQLQDITRLPQSQALRIILNELGAGFAGRGSELHEVIQRADPGLRELEGVLHTFAQQNHVLADLAAESDRALAPIAANREHVAGFIEHSNTVAQASAHHLAAIEENLKLLPGFLKQLGPATERVQRFAEQTTPTFEDLNQASPAINELFENLAPFSKATNRYLVSLGKNGKVTGPALKSTTKLLDQLQPLGASAEPFSTNLAKLLGNLEKTGGIERLMDFIFMSAGSTNGYDKLGHFLRAEAVASNCIEYDVTAEHGCTANFVKNEEEKAKSARASAAGVRGDESTITARTLAILEGKTVAQAIAEYPGSEGLQTGSTAGGSTRPAGGNSAHTTYYKPGAEAPGVSERLLEYLLGS